MLGESWHGDGGVSDRRKPVADGKMLTFGEVEVWLPTFGSANNDVQGAFENAIVAEGR